MIEKLGVAVVADHCPLPDPLRRNSAGEGLQSDGGAALPIHDRFDGIRPERGEAKYPLYIAGRDTVEPCKIREASGFTGDDLLVPDAGASDGFEDGCMALLRRFSPVANDQSQDFSLRTKTELATEANGISFRREHFGAAELFDQSSSIHSDRDRAALDNDSGEDRVQKLLPL